MLRKYGPFDEMFDFLRSFDDLNRMMEEPKSLLGGAMVPRRLLPAGAMKREFMPAVECFMKDGRIMVRVELPGVDPKEIEVSVVGNQLVIRGEKKDQRAVDEKDLFFRELTHGRFERCFTLPEGVKADQVKAVFNNGVLEITLPATISEATRKVPIEVVEAGKKTVKAA